jgi:hypothetical protein
VALRNPLTDAELGQAAEVWRYLLTGDRTVRDVTLRFAISERLARRHLAGLTDHNLLQWWGEWHPSGTTPVDARHYAARVDPHAIHGYQRLFGRPMPGTFLLVIGTGHQLALARSPFGEPPFVWAPIHQCARFATHRDAEAAALAAGVPVDPPPPLYPQAKVIRRHAREFEGRKPRPGMQTVTNYAL